MGAGAMPVLGAALATSDEQCSVAVAPSLGDFQEAVGTVTAPRPLVPSGLCSLAGTVFYATAPGRFTWLGARRHCRSRGASLATTGQLYLAWREGLDQCDPGWLADGSVRYPIRLPRRKCGGEASGVRTLYQFPNRTGFPTAASKFDAYCYKGKGGPAAMLAPRSPPTPGHPPALALLPLGIGGHGWENCCR